MSSNAEAAPKILPDAPHWLDHRLAITRHNDYAWHAVPPASIAEWEKRKAFTIEQVKLAAGLLPEIPPFSGKTEIWGHAQHAGCTIAKVSVETLPGLTLTGNLYLPGRMESQAPGILCPHGHWPEGRLHHDQRGSVPMRCLMFARLGFVVFSYDMIGYNDNNRIQHRWPVELINSASLYGGGLFGLQTWNSLRALDLLCSLPEVDASRIGCTGASGGSSQTWTLALLDQRVKVLAPVCMLSAHFQGGCPCEEPPLLRINGVTSFDILSAIAPRPLLLPSVTRDWTNLVPRYEFPALQQVYSLFKAEDRLLGFHADEEHNYNQKTREHVYPWFTHWLLNQALKTNIPEDTIAPPPETVLRHTSPPQPATPASTRAALEKILPYLCTQALPQPQEKLELWRLDRQRQLSEIINVDLNLRHVAVRVTCPRWNVRSAQASGRLISRRETGDVIAAAWVEPATPNPKTPVFLLVSPKDKNMFFPGGAYAAVLDTLINNACRVLVIELLGSGETAPMLARSPRNPEDPLLHAFNPSLFSMRVQDILTAMTLLREEGYSDIALVSAGEASRPALCALPLAEKPVSQAFIDLDNIHDSSEAWLDPLAFQPMIHKIGGLKGCLLLAAGQRLTLCKPDAELSKTAEFASQNDSKHCRLAITSDSFVLALSRFFGK